MTYITKATNAKKGEHGKTAHICIHAKQDKRVYIYILYCAIKHKPLHLKDICLGLMFIINVVYSDNN